MIMTVSQVSLAAGPSQDSLLSLYTRLDNATHGGEGFSSYDSWEKKQSGCVTCWAQTRVLDSYLDVYLGTKDIKWLDKFAGQAGILLGKTDAKMGRRDFRGLSGPVWSTIHYTGGRPHVWAVHTGMILNPLLRFALLARQRGLGRFDGISARILDAAKKAVTYHEDQYKNKHGLAGYWERANAPSAMAGQYLPWNQQAAMGRALVLLWRLTGDGHYRARAREMGRALKRRIRVSPDGEKCHWPYWTRWPDTPGRMDDINHAAMVMRFMLDLYRVGWVFDQADIQRLANTFLQDILGRNGQASKYVDGSGTRAYRVSAFLWLPLGGVDRQVYRRLKEVHAKNPALLEGATEFQPDHRGMSFQAIALLICLQGRTR